MTQSLPAYTYLLSCIGIFVFQTLDAIDGKQARRTGSSSPLGQLFDHGCDAIAWTISSLSVVSFLQLGLTDEAIVGIFAATSPFYLTNLLEYYSGVYEYNVGNVDGTSGQIMLMFFNVLPFFAGTDVYSRKVKDLMPFLPNFLTSDLQLKHYAMILCVYVGVIYSFILLIYCYKSVSGFGKIFTLTMQVLQMFGVFIIMLLFDETIPFIHDNAGWVYICIALLYAIVTTKLIVCLMCKMHFSYLHAEYLIFLVYFYFQYNYDGSDAALTNLKYAFIGVFVTYLVLYIRLVQTCIDQISEDLGIYCFTLGSRKEKSN